jgi:hypothetical protein
MTAGADDDDALIYVLPGQNPIQWMCSQDYLLIGTLAGVGRWGSNDDESPITPTNPTNYRIQARYGAAYMQSVMVGDAVLYIERGGKRVREFAYNLERDRFLAPDMTVLSEHITGDGIVDIAYQSRPDSILWCVTDDGGLSSLTYQREQEVVGWARHTTDGTFESVETIPSSGEDEVWVVVNRTIDSNTVRYVEQLQPFDWGTDQEDCFFVDSGLSFDGNDTVSITDVNQSNPAKVWVSSWPADADGTDIADGDHVYIASVGGMTELNGTYYTVDDSNSTDLFFTLNDSTDTNDINSVGYTAYTSGGTIQWYEKTFTNLGHLEGETLAVLGDGDVLGTETVASGTITIDEWCNTVHAGLPCTSQFLTMPVIPQLQSGSHIGKISRIDKVLIDFYKSYGDVKYGYSETYDQNVPFYNSPSSEGDPVPLFTGLKQLPFIHGSYRDAAVWMESDDPLPFMIRMMNVSITPIEK